MASPIVSTHTPLLRECQSLLSPPTAGGDRTYDNYDFQNFQPVFTGVPVHIKHIFTGVPKVQTTVHVSKWSPRHSKDLTGKLIDLEMRIFEV